jgi:hypothetical protein
MDTVAADTATALAAMRAGHAVMRAGLVAMLAAHADTLAAA